MKSKARSLLLLLATLAGLVLPQLDIGSAGGEIYEHHVPRVIPSGPWRVHRQFDPSYHPASEALFGSEVSIDASGNVFAASGQRQNTSRTEAQPVVELYRMIRGVWGKPSSLALGIPKQYMNPFTLPAAVSDNGNRVLVGTPGITWGHNPTAILGEIFNFYRGTWHGPTLLSLGRSANADDFAIISVALSGDGNTAMIGAPDRLVAEKQEAGVVEAFQKSSGGWTGPQQLSLGSAGFPYDGFGASVALDRSGDSAVVGIPNRVGSYVEATGAAETFRRIHGLWHEDHYFALHPHWKLGSSVAIDGAGRTILLGAPFRSFGKITLAGAGEVFRRVGTRWTGPAELSLGRESGDFDYTGYVVSLSRTGQAALLGSPGRSVRGQRANGGAVLAFRFVNGAWSGPNQITAPEASKVDDGLGGAVQLTANGSEAAKEGFSSLRLTSPAKHSGGSQRNQESEASAESLNRRRRHSSGDIRHCLFRRRPRRTAGRRRRAGPRGYEDEP